MEESETTGSGPPSRERDALDPAVRRSLHRGMFIVASTAAAAPYSTTDYATTGHGSNIQNRHLMLRMHELVRRCTVLDVLSQPEICRASELGVPKAMRRLGIQPPSPITTNEAHDAPALSPLG